MTKKIIVNVFLPADIMLNSYTSKALVGFEHKMLKSQVFIKVVLCP